MMASGWGILLLMVPGFFLGWFILDRMRRPFNEDPKFMRSLFDRQPATMIAGCTTLGSGVLWAVLRVLRVM
jgi:hypothetical protein